MANALHPIVVVVMAFFLAFMIQITPLPAFIAAYRPDFVTLTAIAFALRCPRYLGVWGAFFIGLLSDGMFNAPIGMHSLLLVGVVAFVAQARHRLLHVPALQQCATISLLLVIEQVAEYALIRSTGTKAAFLPFLWPALVGTLFWIPLYHSVNRLPERV